MFIRLVLIALLIFLCTTDVFGKEQHRDKRPNILIAITDDHSFKHISAQGSPFINTPNVVVEIESVGFTAISIILFLNIIFSMDY